MRQSDHCNKFFHNLVKLNNKRNTLVIITKASGEQPTNLREVANEFVSHFDKLLSTKADYRKLYSTFTTGSVLTELQQQKLTTSVAPEAIRTTLFDICSDRAPGLDGYISNFFKAIWMMMHADIYEAI